jgi:hypothetical protein
MSGSAPNAAIGPLEEERFPSLASLRAAHSDLLRRHRAVGDRPELLDAIAEAARGRADASDVAEADGEVRMTVSGDTKALVDALTETMKTVIKRDPAAAAKLQPRIEIRIETRPGSAS